MPGALGVLQGISSAGYDIVLSCKIGMYKKIKNKFNQNKSVLQGIFSAGYEV
jgi:hypothetical protein